MAESILTCYCRWCKRDLPRQDFQRGKLPWKRRYKRCAACRSKRRSKEARVERLQRKYGLTPQAYEELLRRQDNQCAICGRKTPGGQWGQFCVDHCHKTGQVRGLLCTGCNSTLAFVGDDLEGVWRFMRYLLARGAWESSPRVRNRTRRPFRPKALRYYDPAGRRCRKGDPGARAVRETIETYFVKFAGRVFSLGTTEEQEAIRRVCELTEKCR